MRSRDIPSLEHALEKVRIAPNVDHTRSRDRALAPHPPDHRVSDDLPDDVAHPIGWRRSPTSSIVAFVVDPRAEHPPFEQLKAQVITGIESGDLIAGTKLPTVRALATELGIAPNTVARAYRELENDGLIETRGRNGTVIKARAGDAAALAQLAAQEYAARTRELGVDRRRGARVRADRAEVAQRDGRGARRTAGGVSRPRASVPLGVRSAPPGPASVAISARSSSVSSKSNTSRFSAMRVLSPDFGMTTSPSCTCQRHITCAAVLP